MDRPENPALPSHAAEVRDASAAGKCRQGNRAVQIRPGADDDGVDIGVGDHVLPMFEGARDAELAGDGGGRFRPAIADRDQLYVRQGQEAGDVPQAGVGAGADQADA